MPRKRLSGEFLAASWDGKGLTPYYQVSLCNPSHYECVGKRRLLGKFLDADLSYRIHARLGNQTAAFGA